MVFPLAKNSDQYINFLIGATPYTVHLYEFRGLAYVDVSINQDIILSGHRLLPNTWILPFNHISTDGNFRIETREADKFEYPNYESFDSKFVFAYYSDDEVNEIESSGE